MEANKDLNDSNKRHNKLNIINERLEENNRIVYIYMQINKRLSSGLINVTLCTHFHPAPSFSCRGQGVMGGEAKTPLYNILEVEGITL